MAIEAVWNDHVIARSDQTVVVEGNHYFPPEDVDTAFLLPSTTTSECPWKGTASYYTVEANGEQLEDAAWYYVDPTPMAEQIRGRIAFWKGVEVREV